MLSYVETFHVLCCFCCLLQFQNENNVGFLKQYHSLRPVSNHPACLIFSEGECKSRSISPTVEEAKTDSSAGGTDSVPQERADAFILEDRPQIAPEKYAWICKLLHDS